MHRTTVLLGFVILVSTVALGALPAATTGAAVESGSAADGEAYAGSHVSFETTANALVDYEVGGTTIVQEVAVDSSEEARSGVGVGVDAGLDAVTGIAGASLGAHVQARASVTVESESGATLQANDNANGILQVQAGDESQIATVELEGGASAEQESDSRITVESADGTDGTFILVGDGDLVVNDEGDVTAEIEGDGEGELVYRQYDGDRDDDDEERERMIAEGMATAEVFVQGSAEDGQETGADAVEYAGDTTIEVTQETSSRVEFTAERAESDGRVIVSSVSEEAFDRAEDIEVTVDGEAAAHVESVSEAEAAAQGGDGPAYYVSQSSSAEATANVFVAVDGFSERQVAMESNGDADDDHDHDDGADADDGHDHDDGADDGDSIPGFGIAAAVIALVGAALLVRRVN